MSVPMPPALPLRQSTQLSQFSYDLSHPSTRINDTLKSQQFWKYHILRVSPFKFYLTTNPDSRHHFTRPAPGYYVHLQFPNSSSNHSLRDGFRLLFRQQDFGLTESIDTFAVEKLNENLGGHLIVSFRENEYLDSTTGLIRNNNKSQIQQKKETPSSSLSPLPLQQVKFERQKIPSAFGKTGTLMFSNYKRNEMNTCQLCPIDKSLFGSGTKIDGVNF
ncbi:unnamed protein product [Ambrosiozyma monospora]|uniref:Unnamed protein product n=1 Tax=Ambrosiozyma monospora TaxID=43982 RepID=A0ACB5T502_AMBMO|nr:unnamed protein product [Ambrosiozyma monospora]